MLRQRDSIKNIKHIRNGQKKESPNVLRLPSRSYPVTGRVQTYLWLPTAFYALSNTQLP